MKIKRIILSLIIIVVGMLDMASDYEEYMMLKNFIQKTKNLDYEWVIYFDYFTGEVLKMC